MKNLSDLVEVSSWVSSDMCATAQQKIATDRRAVNVIDDLLSQGERPEHMRDMWSVDLSLTISSRFDVLANDVVLEAINDALPSQDGAALLVLAKERLLARIAALEEIIAK